MTLEEFIQKLSSHPKDAEVFFRNDSGNISFEKILAINSFVEFGDFNVLEIIIE